jgi:hypothetical protein
MVEKSDDTVVCISDSFLVVSGAEDDRSGTAAAGEALGLRSFMMP